ncbi:MULTISPECIES: hypothetical protein [unclassified Moraxella]|uniref:hypothetical protein n=1 Tax=unclassified Moraxella TaxID=2685852 RepID=UPI003AF7DE71
MVKVGFIVEGETEKIIIESEQFRAFLQKHGYELIDPVVNAKGGGNLLPKNIEPSIKAIEQGQPDKIFVLTDLENNASIADVRQRIYHAKIELVFVAVKAIEAWFLADTQAMKKFLKSENFALETYPEQTVTMPFDRIKEIIMQLKVRGIGSKVLLAKQMTKHHGFSIENSANHPNCPSAKELVDYFTLHKEL